MKPPPFATSKLPAAGLLLTLTLYLTLSLYQLDLPGLHNDEAQEAGLQAVQLATGRPVTAFRGASLTIGRLTLPLMVQDYIGALNVAIALPFVRGLGATVAALRLPAVLLGALTLILLHRLVGRLASPGTGALAALLLAVQPSFVFWMRQGVYVTNLTLPLGLALLLAGEAWARRGGRRLALAMGLLAGLGLYAKLLFVWLLGGALGAAALLNLARMAYPPPPPPHLGGSGAGNGGRGNWLWPRRPTAGELAAAGAGALLGLLPLLAYNLQTGGTLLRLGGNLTTSFYGVNNREVFANLAARWDQLRAVLAGRDHLWYLGGSAGNPLWEWALALACALLVFNLRRSTPDVQRSAFSAQPFLPLTLGLAFLQTPFTVSGIFPTHFAVLIWLPPAIVALAAGRLPVLLAAAVHKLVPPAGTSDVHRRRKRGVTMRIARRARGLARAARLLPPLLLLLLWTGDLRSDLRYHRYLRASGGLGPHSDAIYRLESALAALPPGTPLFAMDWGFSPQVRYLSTETLAPLELFGYSFEPDADFAARVEAAVAQPGAVFLFHWPQETIFPRRAAFEALLAERGLRAETVQDVSRRDGAPVFQLVMVSRAGAAAGQGKVRLRVTPRSSAGGP